MKKLQFLLVAAIGCAVIGTTTAAKVLRAGQVVYIDDPTIAGIECTLEEPLATFNQTRPVKIANTFATLNSGDPCVLQDVHLGI